MGKLIKEFGEVDSFRDSIKLNAKVYRRIFAKAFSDVGLFGITYNNLVSAVEDVKKKDKGGELTPPNNTITGGKTKYLTPKVERGSYDPARGILTINGQRVYIIKQKNKTGRQKEPKQAVLMRQLFNDVNSPFGVTPMHVIFPVKRSDFDDKYRNRVRSYILEINEKIDQEAQVKDFLFKHRDTVKINDLYL